MKEIQWKLGDVVKHKSGKRKMQVVDILGGMSSILHKYVYECKWETVDGFDRADFEWWELEKYKE